MVRNKYANPPYLHKYDKEKARRLFRTLKMLNETCCRWHGLRGAMRVLNRLLLCPSSIRKCDLPEIYNIVDAINELE